MSVDWKRVLIFIAIAFGISWSVALLLFLIQEQLNQVETIILIAAGYMPAPALAHVITRTLTREGWQDVWLRPNFKPAWPYWLIAWLLAAPLIAIGAALFFALFPAYFDPQLGQLAALLAAQEQQTGQEIPLTPMAILLIQTAQAIIIAPAINALPIFGEEFGWRAYLQPKLMPLGGRKAMLLMGLIWGVWHWPIIALGHNYGLDYAGFPWLGMLAMVWFTLALGTVMGWLTLKAGSVWPAVILHGSVNGIAAVALLMAQAEPPLLLGPSIAGLIGGAGFALLALVIFVSPHALEAEVKSTG